ncbi:MAG: hypothetical protein WC683_09980 [bacterium]
MHRHSRTIDGSDLFDGTARAYSGGPPCVSHSVTSVEAAESIDHTRTGGRACLLRFLLDQANHGATDEEMQTATGMNPSTQRPRRCELVEMGKVRDSSNTRPTKSGRKAVVWVLNQGA